MKRVLLISWISHTPSYSVSLTTLHTEHLMTLSVTLGTQTLRTGQQQPKDPSHV
jgi:hypothetical protein